MGKSKSPEPPGNLNRGLAAYRQTLSQGGRPPPDSPEAPEGLLRTVPAQGAASTAASVPAAHAKAANAASLKGLLKKAPLQKPGKSAGGESKYRRLAKFLILVGEEEASRLLSALDLEQVEAVSQEIASIRGISAEESEEILEEFRSLLDPSYGYAGGAAGGVAAARRLLYAAYGPEKGEAFLRKAVPGVKEGPFQFLEDFTGDQVALLLREESPAMAALVLSRLSSKTAAAVLANVPPDRKLDIVRRIVRLGRTDTEVLDRVAAALREKARHIADAGSGPGLEVDGMGALAAILKHADISFGDRLLTELEDKAPDIGRDLKERLYTLEDVLDAEDRPIQGKLKTMEDRDIALLLKGRPPEFVEKILSNVSANRRALIREEGEVMGPVPKIEAEAAVRDFLAWFRQGREEGRILLLTDKDVVL
jgi:flagellar motor switch protein FliG